MNHLSAAVDWLLDAQTWTGPGQLGARATEHLGYTAVAVLIAAVIALPAGLAIGHTGRGRAAAVLSSGAVRALPTLGLLTLAALAAGVGLVAPLIALVVLAVPSILAGAYAGVESVDRATVDAARAQGMNAWQVLWRVEVPLGLPIVIGGLRLAVLQVTATATLAAYVGAGGLGRPLFLGLRTYDYPMMLGASLVVILLAILLDACFEVVQRLLSYAPGLARTGRLREAR
ncbi:ABC transporter permease [Sediminivirga luteola]|uniref:ABC transporter permease n=1 Tax=Sediminivirga luteola TaxID=1774748 RepID=A0A8J2TXX9_9MICO|nr:ABC transporter permease [Sediminivirga luteola]GGA14618.1 ABC transporter permease [Sediminivirga luteola]